MSLVTQNHQLIPIIFVSYFPEAKRGGQINLLRLLGGINSHIFLPILVVSRYDTLAAVAIQIGIAVEIIELRHPLNQLDLGAIHSILRLRKLLLRTRSRILYVDGPDHVCPAWLAAQRLNVQLVWHVQTSLKTRYDNLNLRRADVIVCCSRGVLERFQESSKKVPIRSIVNAVDTKRFHPGKGIQVRQSLGVSVDTPVLLFVGEIEELKGLGDLFWAFAKVRESIPKARLWIAGSGNQKQIHFLQSLSDQLGITASIDWLGYRQDIEQIFRAATLFVFPSYSEGLSLALLEAMASGCPVVATNIPGNTEVVTSESGSLVSVRDPSAIAEAVLNLLKDPLHASRQSEAALSQVLKHHQVEDFVSAFSHLFEELTVLKGLSNQMSAR
jgi:glycosyltransferase involved in cell wall biosynthesis